MNPTVARPDHRVHGGGAPSGPSPRTVALADDGIDRLASARPEEFAELFCEALTDDFGAVARLHQMLETASEWCLTHEARGSASELGALADRLTDLGEELHLVGEGLGHEIHFHSHRTAAAARISPAVSVSGPSVGQQKQAPAPIPPSTVRSLPHSR
ncbi:hypothetical protein [Streptomyces sp. H27-C3]|uniref:hypothetical protein n=1 Tax=Streptomyces sp. H27-C3 TaxID=3046305 RepID=UPI0024BA2B17|nr:hypothetical protein [Streptomyces sp. H27-C3]MDJ0465726.1 hypothetical protein [Streptomyces sp. H27-C3]